MFSSYQTWYSLINSSPFLPSLQLLAATILLSVSMILTTLDSSYIGLAKKFIQVFPHDCMEKPKRTSWPTNKWTNTILVFLRLVYKYNVLKAHPFCSVYRDFLPL